MNFSLSLHNDPYANSSNPFASITEPQSLVTLTSSKGFVAKWHTTTPRNRQPKSKRLTGSSPRSVTEKTYDFVHANCTMNLREGDLTFAKVIKLYTHRCFQRYPHFQVDDLYSTPKTVINNSIHVRSPQPAPQPGQRTWSPQHWPWSQQHSLSRLPLY
jgi:hypothetical protein